MNKMLEIDFNSNDIGDSELGKEMNIKYFQGSNNCRSVIRTKSATGNNF